MYDAIVVGARCAGSPLAMLLARKGYRVLLLDRASFPSDMRMSTHFIHQPGIAQLERWNLLDRIASSGCPPVMGYTYDFGEFALMGAPPACQHVTAAYAPRRTVLDNILVDAAVESGVELREQFSVEALAEDNGRVTGVRGSAANGRATAEETSIVIGADGMNSLVARCVRAPQYNTVARRQLTYFSYWSGVEIEGLEFYPRDYRAVYGWNTNDGLALVGVNWALEQFPTLPAGIEESFFAVVDQAAPSLAARLRAGRREERWSGGSIPGFFRKPYGPGWALVGDAGYKMDPCTAAGITNAFRDAELLAEAIDDGLASRRPLEEALAEYERLRNAVATPIYEFACQSALFEPATDQMKQLLSALRDDPVETSHFFGLLAQTTPIREFLNPDNLTRIVGRRD
jgi:2-polyprenyl-6-methoxyphenol hydroxylase-like FAD-dependent oxidoreductase